MYFIFIFTAFILFADVDADVHEDQFSSFSYLKSSLSFLFSVFILFIFSFQYYYF